MTLYNYMDNDTRKSVGPVSVTTLSRMVESGILNQDTLVREEGQTKWVKLGTIELRHGTESSVKRSKETKLPNSKVVGLGGVLTLLIVGGWWVLSNGSIEVPLSNRDDPNCWTKKEIDDWQVGLRQESYSPRVPGRDSVLITELPADCHFEVRVRTGDDFSSNVRWEKQIGVYRRGQNPIDEGYELSSDQETEPEWWVTPRSSLTNSNCWTEEEIRVWEEKQTIDWVTPPKMVPIVRRLSDPGLPCHFEVFVKIIPDSDPNSSEGYRYQEGVTVYERDKDPMNEGKRIYYRTPTRPEWWVDTQ